ncbi:unnamed protein product, partial [Sphacelaria rigidula]
MWIATMAKPDPSFAAHNVAKFSDNPGPAHWKAVMEVMKYLKRTTDYGIVYGGTSGNDTELSAWVDADHATCPNTRHSVSGAAFMLAGGDIRWFSQAHELTASARSESEYIAPAEATNELHSLRQVKPFMSPPADTRIPLHEHNRGAKKMTNNRFSSRRTRHIDVKHQVVRDAINISFIRVEKVNSGEQHADILTKALDAKTFERH